MKRILAIASLFAFTVAFVLGTSATQAQYPPPVGSVTLTGNATSAPAGTSVNLTVTVRSGNGEAVVDQSTTIAITSEPGGTNGDAGLDGKTFTKNTDANGQIADVLHVGSTPGTLLLTATSGGLQSTLVIQVTGAGTSAGSASPPASGVEGNVILPPNTGDGGLLP